MDGGELLSIEISSASMKITQGNNRNDMNRTLDAERQNILLVTIRG